jgi:hypothetical protein
MTLGLYSIFGTNGSEMGYVSAPANIRNFTCSGFSEWEKTEFYLVTGNFFRVGNRLIRFLLGLKRITLF